MKSITAQNHDFKHFVEEIKSKIHSANASALKAVNKELIALYSDIGKIIVQRQERFGWGKSVVESLSKELQSEIEGLSGFSPRNLWNMRQYYLTYKDNEFLQTLSREISWSHNVLIFQKCKDDLQKEFYIKSTLKHAWSYRVLDNHIDNQTYEKSLLSQNNFKSTLPQNLSIKTALILKDEYTFDFLSLNNEHSERELELALIKQVREFLTQMGSEYAFMGNQYKLEADGQEFFIDLLLYHRGLKSLITMGLRSISDRYFCFISFKSKFIKSPNPFATIKKQQERIALILGVWDSAIDSLASRLKAKHIGVYCVDFIFFFA